MREWLHIGFVSAIIVTAAGLLVSLLQGGVPTGSVYEPGVVTIFALFLASFVTLYPLVRNFSRNDDPLEPSVIIGGLLFLYFPLPAFGIAILGFDPAFPAFINGSDRLLPAFTQALIVISIATATFYAGYSVANRSRESRTWPMIGRRRLLVTNVVIIWILSTTLHLFRAFELLNSGNAIFFHLTNWHYLAALVVLASYFEADGEISSSRLVVFVLAVEAMVTTVVAFDLNTLLTLVTFVALAYHYVGPGITYRKLAALGVFIAVLFPVSEIAEDLQAGLGLQEAVSHGGLGVLWYLDAFVGRMIGIDALTMIIARTPDPVPFQSGQTLLLAVYGLVPRAFWSGKPSIIMCGVNNQYFSGRGVDANTCAAMTVPGELYWNFGALGVVGGFFVIGILLGGLYRWFRGNGSSPRNYVLLVVFALVLLQLMRFEWGVGQVVSNLAKRLGFAAVFLWFVTTPSHGSAFTLDGESTLERSGLVRSANAVARTRPVRFTAAGLGVGRLTSALGRFPARVSGVFESSETYRFALVVDRWIPQVWARQRERVSEGVSRITVSGSLVEHSRMYTLFKSAVVSDR